MESGSIYGQTRLPDVVVGANSYQTQFNARTEQHSPSDWYGPLLSYTDRRSLPDVSFSLTYKRLILE